MKKQFVALLLVLSWSSAASAQDALVPDIEGVEDTIASAPSLGFQHLFAVSLYYQHASHFDEEEAEPEGAMSLGIMVEGAMAIVPTVLGGSFGFEAEAFLGFPLSGYFGLIGAQVGTHLRILGTDFLKLGSGLGFGFGSHLYGYVQPRLALLLGPAELEASFQWTPQYASHPWGQGGLESTGIGHQRLRISAFINFGEPGEDFGQTAVRLYVERHEFEGDAENLADKNLEAGTYWGGGIGYAF